MGNENAAADVNELLSKVQSTSSCLPVPNKAANGVVQRSKNGTKFTNGKCVCVQTIRYGWHDFVLQMLR